MVASTLDKYINCFDILFWVNSSNNHNKSGTPSPVTAEVGTIETYFDNDLFWKYNSEFKPCSANATLICSSLLSNSAFTGFFCLANESRKELFGVESQSYNLSILFNATIKGAFLSLNNLIDSSVCCSNPCIISITKMAMLHKDEPRDLKLVKDS